MTMSSSTFPPERGTPYEEATVKGQNYEFTSLASFGMDKLALQMSLVKLIERGEWRRLRRVFQIPALVNAAQSLHENPALFGANLLHVALRNGAPLIIVKRIMSSLPETPFLSDAVGRFPLHMASSFSSAKVVAAVACAYPGACLKQDLDGRLPLHYACDASRAPCQEDEPHQGHCCVDAGTVLYLVSIAPSSVNVNDIENRNVIEVAVLSNAPLQIVVFLQNVCAAELEKLMQPRGGVVAARAVKNHHSDDDKSHGNNALLSKEGSCCSGASSPPMSDVIKDTTYTAPLKPRPTANLKVFMAALQGFLQVQLVRLKGIQTRG